MRLGTIIHYRSPFSWHSRSSANVIGNNQKSSTFTLVVFHLSFYLLVFGYMYLGALFYYHIEAGNEMEEILKKEMNTFVAAQQPHLHFEKISDIAKIMAARYHSDRHVVESLLKDFVLELKKEGYEIKEAPTPAELEAEQAKEVKLKWDFPSSFLFAFTILATIGYGNIAPATDMGKIFTMVYAFFGVPMFLVALIDLGAFGQLGIRRVVDAIRQKCAERRNKGDKAKEEEEETKEYPTIQRLIEFVCTMLAFAGFIFIGATILPIWEDNLSFFSATYYTFITITAIGLGDIGKDCSK